MSRKIQVKRGLKKDLPTLSVAELGFTTDTHALYVGTPTGNKEFPNGEELRSTAKELDDAIAKVGVIDEKIGKASGIASLGADGKVPANQLPEQDIEFPIYERYGTAQGGNVKAIDFVPPIRTLTPGLAIRFKNVIANTGAVSLVVDAGDIVPIVKNGNVALTSGNLKMGGVYTVVYDGANFILQGEGGDLSDAEMTALRNGVNALLNS